MVLQTVNATAEITGQNIKYLIDKDITSIGRNSRQGTVDLSLNMSTMISRTHLIINRKVSKFYLFCVSNNGIFVDGAFKKKDVNFELEKK